MKKKIIFCFIFLLIENYLWSIQPTNKNIFKYNNKQNKKIWISKNELTGIIKHWTKFSNIHKKSKISFDEHTGLIKKIIGFKTIPLGITPETSALNFINSERELLEIDTNNIKLQNKFKHKNYNHVVYNQVYKNIPVENSQVKVHLTDNNEVIALYSQYKPNINLDINPSITVQDAIKTVQNNVNQQLGNIKSELVILPHPENGNYLLAWKINCYTYNPISNWIYYIDAIKNEIIFYYDNIRHNTYGTVKGKAFYSVGAEIPLLVPLSNQYVYVNTTRTVTDINGCYSSDVDGTVFGQLNGPYVTVVNDDIDNAFYHDGTGYWSEINYTTSSPHPYPAKYDNFWIITHPGAVIMKLHFSVFDIDPGFDNLFIYDKFDQLVGIYNGLKNPFWTPAVYGDTIKVRLKSEFFNNRYGFVIDKYAYFICGTSPSVSPSWIWDYMSTDSHFDELNVFYHINLVHDYFKNVLGLSVTDFPICTVVHYGEKYSNAFYDSTIKIIAFGDGDGVYFLDFASASDVIYHEYTHAVQENIFPGLYFGQSGAMMEAWADYFAASITDDPRIGEWVFTQGYLRQLNNNYKYPDNYVNEVHYDGQIYAGALWDIRTILGKEIADKIVADSLFFQPDSFEYGLEVMLLSDDDDTDLSNGTPHKTVIETAFAKHGIPCDRGIDTYEPNDSFTDAYGPITSMKSYYSYIWDTGDIDYYYFYCDSGTVLIGLTNIPPGCDYDLYLFDSELNIVAMSINSGNINESIALSTATVGKKYYIMVNSFQGSTTSYQYILSAGYYSVVSDTTPPVGKPSKPAGQDKYTNTNVIFRWTQGDAVDPETGIQGYVVQISTAPQQNILFQNSVLNSSIIETTGCVSGLTYYCRVKPINGANIPADDIYYSDWSDGVTVDTSPPSGRPGPIIDNGTVSLGPNINFSWSIGDSTDTESGISGYWLQVSSVTDFSGLLLYDGYTGNMLNKTVGKCMNGKTYYARVKARNGAGLYTDWSDITDGITINDTPPSVSIESPLNNSEIKGIITVNVTATDTDAISKVEFYISDKLYSVDVSTPYTYNWDTFSFVDGNYVLKVVAYDSSLQKDEQSVNVVVKNGIAGAYFDDIEHNKPGWIHYIVSSNNASGIIDNWTITDIKAYSPIHSWYSGKEQSGETGGATIALETPEFDLVNSNSAFFSFYHYYEFDSFGDTYPDGGIVEITVDNGITWTEITPVNNYPGVITRGYRNPLNGYSAFVGTSNGWKEEKFCLNNYVGNKIKMRFVVGYDYKIYGQPNEGWYIDDICLSSSIIQPVVDGKLTCYNNIFNPVKGEYTIIEYKIIQKGKLSIDIYNLAGELIKNLVYQYVPDNYHYKKEWDGRNNAGEIVPSGIYLVNMQAEGISLTQKVCVIK